MTELKTLQDAYVLLLSLPHGGVRERLQPVLANLRDLIAEGSGLSAEQIQDHFGTHQPSTIAGRCWFHRWTPWQQYDFNGLVTGMLGRPLFPHVEFSERRQRRTCVRCSKEQDELVRRG